MSTEADEVVACLEQPGWFYTVSQFYDDFAATTDREVINLLDEAAAAHRHDPDTRAATDDHQGSTARSP
jgi:predicted phosphoribosyltransferase